MLLMNGPLTSNFPNELHLLRFLFFSQSGTVYLSTLLWSLHRPEGTIIDLVGTTNFKIKGQTYSDAHFGKILFYLKGIFQENSIRELVKGGGNKSQPPHYIPTALHSAQRHSNIQLQLTLRLKF